MTPSKFAPHWHQWTSRSLPFATLGTSTGKLQCSHQVKFLSSVLLCLQYCWMLWLKSPAETTMQDTGLGVKSGCDADPVVRKSLSISWYSKQSVWMSQHTTCFLWDVVEHCKENKRSSGQGNCVISLCDVHLIHEESKSLVAINEERSESPPLVCQQKTTFHFSAKLSKFYKSKTKKTWRRILVERGNIMTKADTSWCFEKTLFNWHFVREFLMVLNCSGQKRFCLSHSQTKLPSTSGKGWNNMFPGCDCSSAVVK